MQEYKWVAITSSRGSSSNLSPLHQQMDSLLLNHLESHTETVFEGNRWGLFFFLLHCEACRISLTKDRTHVPYSGSTVVTTESPGKSKSSFEEWKDSVQGHKEVNKFITFS